MRYRVDMKHLMGAVIMAALVLAQGGFDGPGRYEITNLKSGKVMDLDRNDQTTVIQFSPRGTDNQRWDIEPAGQNLFYIRNAMNGRALEAPQNSNSAPLVCGNFNRNPNQQWNLQPGKDGNLLIISRWGKTIDVPDGSSRDGLHLQIYDPNGDSNQRFILRRVGRPPMRDREDDRRPVDRDRDGGAPRNREPDAMGRFWDDREQTWKLAGDGVCFYRDRDFRGDAFCTRAGNPVGDIGRDSNFGSVRLFGRVRGVEVFERPGFGGERFRITRDMRELDRTRVGSFRLI
jgi:hypothetical protein